MRISKAAQAVEVRTNIRFVDAVHADDLAALLKGEKLFSEIKRKYYILAFFEEVYPSLMKKFMAEFSISRDDILTLYHRYQGEGEMRKFREALADGKF